MEPAPTHPGKPWHRRHRVRRPGGSPSANREAATPTVGQGLAGEGRHSLGHRSILVRVPKRREFNNNRESIWAPKKQRQSRGLFQPPRGLHRRANALGLFHPARADPSAIVSIATTVGRSRLASKASRQLPIQISDFNRQAGNSARKVLPSPTCDSMASIAWWRNRMCLTMASPRPVPPVSRERPRSTR